MGETFIVEIAAQDLRAAPLGLGGAGLRIRWDPRALQEIDSPFNPSDASSPLVTQSFPEHRTGTLDNADGVINGLEGTTDAPLGAGNLIGISGPDVFSILQFRAVAPVQDSSISMTDQQGVGFVPARSYSDSDLIFQSAAITVLPASQVATTTTTTSTPTSSTTTTVPTSTTTTVPTSTTTTVPTSTTTTVSTSTTTTPTTQAAEVGLQMSLYQDAGGVPGSQITNDTVTAGSSFFVKITAQDLRATPQGIGGLSVNLAWNPRVLQEIDSPFNPTSATSSLVSSDLPLYRSGQLNNTAGTIEDLGGVAFPASNEGTAIGINGPQTFSLLHFQALATTGSSTFSLAIGSSGLGIVNGSVDPSGGVSIQPLTVTVSPAPAAAPPQITLSTSDANSSSIQFTTLVDNGGSSTFTSPLVRPADPDTKQYVDVTNSGASPLTISQIEINAADVTVDQAVPLVIAAGQTLRLHLKYAPTLPNPQNETPESFQASAGLVLVSNAANSPQVDVALWANRPSMPTSTTTAR